MPLPLFADRVKESTQSTGTGGLSLDGPEPQFRGFLDAAASGSTWDYAIVHETLDEWEVCQGVATAGSPDTLSRTYTFSSSNSGSPVNFSAGKKFVFSTLPSYEPIITSGRGDQQYVNGGNVAGGSLYLLSTSHGTKGIIFIGSGAAQIQVNENTQEIIISNSNHIITLSGLPTSDPGVPGRLWNDSGTVKIST